MITVRVEVSDDEVELAIARHGSLIRMGDSGKLLTARLLGDAVGRIIAALAGGDPDQIDEMMKIAASVSRSSAREVPTDPGVGVGFDTASAPGHHCDGVGCC